MTKYVITTSQVTKRVYVIDAFSESEALDKLRIADKTLHLDEQTFDVETINEYEFNKEWKPQPDYPEGHDFTPKKDHEGYQYDAFKDQDLFRDD